MVSLSLILALYHDVSRLDRIDKNNVNGRLSIVENSHALQIIVCVAHEASLSQSTSGNPNETETFKALVKALSIFPFMPVQRRHRKSVIRKIFQNPMLDARERLSLNDVLYKIGNGMFIVFGGHLHPASELIGKCRAIPGTFRCRKRGCIFPERGFYCLRLD